MSLVHHVVFVPLCAWLSFCNAGQLSALQAIAECQLNIGLTACCILSALQVCVRKWYRVP